jgi:hypothetical protein
LLSSVLHVYNVFRMCVMVHCVGIFGDDHDSHVVHIWWWSWQVMWSIFGSSVSCPHVFCWVWICIFCLYFLDGTKLACLCYLSSFRHVFTINVPYFNASVLWFTRIWCVNRAILQF